MCDEHVELELVNVSNYGPIIYDKSLSTSNDGDIPQIELSQLIPLYVTDKQNLKFAHINVNSIRHKFGPLLEVMQKGIIDVLTIQECKIDSSFPTSQFYSPDFKMYRKDQSCTAGGLLLYVRNDLVRKRRSDLEFDVSNQTGRVETICIEVYIRSERWIICTVYKQPKLKDCEFYNIFERAIGSISHECSNYVIMGDLNINMLKCPGAFSSILDTYGCKNPHVIKIKTLQFLILLALMFTNELRKFPT